VTDSQLAEAKRSLRSRIRQELRDVDPGDAARWSADICSKLASWPPFVGAKTVFTFRPFPGEVDVNPIARAGLALGKRVCLPRIDWATRTLAVVAVPSVDTGLIPDRQGIHEPRADLPAIGPSEVDLVVVPGLAYDRSGNRLGRGAGFYDRFLSQAGLKAVLVSPAFRLQVLDTVPVDRWDVPVHAIVTESELIQVRREP
jgi:5-formyltetrahydrofolate cyclo-ligase